MTSIPTLIAQVDALLPQTQCERCGYKGCKPYAEAVVRDNELYTLCQPGGQATSDLLGELLGRSSQKVEKSQPMQVAMVREDDCIGCTKCIQACPVDAIVGSSKSMHTIIESECTGCELCIPPCPTFCIDMVPLNTVMPDPQSKSAKAQALHFKSRFINRKERLAKQFANQHKALNQKTQVDIKAEIFKSLSRVNAKKANQNEPTKARRDI